MIERFLAGVKLLANFVSINNKVFYENCLYIKPPSEYLNNLHSSSMNNVMALDYAVKDLTHDSDYILPRWS